MNVVGCRAETHVRRCDGGRGRRADGSQHRVRTYAGRVRMHQSSIKSCRSHHASIPMHGSRAAAKAGHKKRIPFFQKQKIYNDSSVSVHRYLAIYLGTTCSQRISLRRSDGPPRDRGLHRSRWRECPDINFLLRWDGECIIVAWLII